jgi:hypothetical protein
LLLRREMGQLENAARSLYREADRHITQVDQLRALLIEKDGIIATKMRLFITGKIKSMKVM